MSARASSVAAVEVLQRVVEVGLVVVEQHQRGGLELGDLAGDLGADPPAAPGDQHPAPGQQLPHRGEVDVDRVAPEEVLDVELAHVAQAGHAVHPRLRGAEHAHGHVGLLGAVATCLHQRRVKRWGWRGGSG